VRNVCLFLVILCDKHRERYSQIPVIPLPWKPAATEQREGFCFKTITTFVKGTFCLWSPALCKEAAVQAGFFQALTLLTSKTFWATATITSEYRDGRKARFQCSLVAVVKGVFGVFFFRDHWKNLRDRFCLSKHLNKHWVQQCFSWCTSITTGACRFKLWAVIYAETKLSSVKTFFSITTYGLTESQKEDKIWIKFSLASWLTLFIPRSSNWASAQKVLNPLVSLCLWQWPVLIL